MSISFNPNNRLNSVQNYLRNSEMKRAAHTSQSTDAARTTADFDKLNITRNETFPDDSSFASILAKKTAESVKQGISSAKVAEIRQKVQTGTYHVDATRIAEHMLGYKK
jgi:flagellar biosynthesis anti-sigma factor FlgM